MTETPQEPLPHWPQFSLRTLLVAVAVCGVVVAVMGKLGPMWSVALGWFLFLGVVHVCGNFWGHRLRDHHQHLDPEDKPPDYATPRHGPQINAAPSTRLRSTAELGRTMIFASAAGALLAGAAVTLGLALLAGDGAGYTGVAVGGCSAAVIGGLVGYLASSFLAVFLAAWGQASRDIPSAEASGPGKSR
jgi:hypothetical protein